MAHLNWVKAGGKNGKAGYLLSFEYDEDIVRQLKETIPADLREWRPDEKRWWVSGYCESQINDIFKGFIEAVRSQRRLFE